MRANCEFCENYALSGSKLVIAYKRKRRNIWNNTFEFRLFHQNQIDVNQLAKRLIQVVELQ